MSECQFSTWLKLVPGFSRRPPSL